MKAPVILISEEREVLCRDLKRHLFKPTSRCKQEICRSLNGLAHDWPLTNYKLFFIARLDDVLPIGLNSFHMRS